MELIDTSSKQTQNPSSSTSSPKNSTNGHHLQIPTRFESNPYPTTFVQANASNFKQVVQLLTGSSEPTSKNPTQDPFQPPKNFTIPPIKSPSSKKQQSFKLYERRNSHMKNSLMINNIPSSSSSGFSSPSSHEIPSPSLLNFPSLSLSPVTPLNEDMFNKFSPSTLGSSSEEEKAIAEKGFYLHPSPATTPRESEPKLLALFPVTSPRVNSSESSSSGSRR